MEPTSSMFESIMYPTGLFTAPLRHLGTHVNLDSGAHEKSQTNPKNRLDSLGLPNNLQWRIDDADADGTRFFAVPTFAVGKPPLRVDVYIPDQLHHPAGLRAALQSHKALLVGGRELTKLGISRLILQRLHSWSNTYADGHLESTYFSLPFGSRIVLDAISSDIDKIPVHLVPNYDIERQWLTAAELQDLWQLTPDQWPPILDHSSLQLERQIHEAISVVRLAHLPDDASTFAFKSVSSDVKYFYHELHTLLTTPRHCHIMSPPLYVVTKQCRFGGRIGVCGFVLPFYPLGTLRDALQTGPRSLQSSSTPRFPLSDRLHWARQVLSALLHIRNSPMGFYTDLKPNNVLLTASASGSLDTLLVDFEQRGSWYSWSPPEIYYLEYLEILSASHLVPLPNRTHYTAVLKSYLPSWAPQSRRARYGSSSSTTPSRGFSQPWTSLPLHEQESAQVFMFGKLLWCLLESVGFPNSCVTVETFREEPSDLSFPAFRRTPAPLRDCVRRCTAGAPEWRGRLPSVVRVGERLFPRGMTGRGGEEEGTAEQTQEAARAWWREEVGEAERFVYARVRRREGREEPGDEDVLGFLGERPTLVEVEEMLGSFAKAIMDSTES